MSRLLHPNAAHVADTLISRGHHGVVVSSPEGTHTAADAAAALGVEVGAIVKSMVFLLGDEPVLLLVSGAHNVHLERTGERLGGTLMRASLDTAKHATGQPIGGIAPVGHPTNLDTFVDQDLAATPRCGRPPVTPTRSFGPRSPSWCASPQVWRSTSPDPCFFTGVRTRESGRSVRRGPRRRRRCRVGCRGIRAAAVPRR